MSNAITIEQWIKQGNVKTALRHSEGSRFQDPETGIEYEVRDIDVTWQLLGAVTRSGSFAHKGPITKGIGYSVFKFWDKIIPL